MGQGLQNVNGARGAFLEEEAQVNLHCLETEASIPSMMYPFERISGANGAIAAQFLSIMSISACTMNARSFS
jgi:hypothetical protein